MLGLKNYLKELKTHKRVGSGRAAGVGGFHFWGLFCALFNVVVEASFWARFRRRFGATSGDILDQKCIHNASVDSTPFP